MGMAASQARYLALVARKSNCEYEGQQINQSRLVLSNQSAELFNQMLTMEVPVPPSKSDYTYKQYSYKIGDKTYTIDKWDQLAQADSGGYNYVVTYHYNSSEYTGYQQYKLNPQVQFSGVVPAGSSYDAQIAAIKSAQDEVDAAQQAYDDISATYASLKSLASKLTTYSDTLSCSNVTKCEPNSTTDPTTYTVYQQKKTDNGLLIFSTTEGGTDYRYYNPVTAKYYTDAAGTTEDTSPVHNYYKVVDGGTTYTKYSALPDGELKTKIESAIKDLIEYGALPNSTSNNDVFINTSATTDKAGMAFVTDLLELSKGAKSTLPLYYYGGGKPEGDEYKNIYDIHDMETEVNAAKTNLELAKRRLELAENTFKSLDIPSYVGNAELTSLNKLSDNQLAAIKQIIADMKKEDISNNIIRCFNTMDETYTAENYTGGIYTYDQAGKTYYTTYYDLVASATAGTGINQIDNQPKLPYYGAEFMDVPKTVTEKAIVDADASGRFVSIRFENDSVVYALNTETATDEVAYDDAMNQYNYEKALYDKRVQDINVKTSLIHRQDQNLELRLKQLDTEQNALNTEIDAVSKVVKDNIEKSFKTFGG